MSKSQFNLPMHYPSRGVGANGEVCITGGEIVGNTLVIECDSGNVNIPLEGIECAINFENLKPLQIAALRVAIRGDLVCDAFDTPLGHLL